MVTVDQNGLSFPRVDCDDALRSLGPLPATRTRTPSPTITPTPSITPTGSLLPTQTATVTPSETATAASTATETSTTPGLPCAGDCDSSQNVSINELVLSVNIALDRAPLSTCINVDRDGSGLVTIDELVASVNNALRNCA
jgi:hypothetical protein